jgi:hypothetical protein
MPVNLLLAVTLLGWPPSEPEAAERPEAWVCGSIIDATAWMPAYRSITYLRLGVGTPPRLGLGVGTAVFQSFGPRFGPPYLCLPSLDIIFGAPLGWLGYLFPDVDESDAVGWLPLTVYWVPVTNWYSSGLGRLVLYAQTTANFWLSPERYLHTSAGVASSPLAVEFGVLGHGDTHVRPHPWTWRAYAGVSFGLLFRAIGTAAD